MARFADAVTAMMLFFVLWPVSAVIAMHIRRSSPGPLLVATRWRRGDGTVVYIPKFRMTERDPSRMSPLERFIDRYDFDRIPGLMSVILGQLTLKDLWNQAR
ncbi:MAG: sugar transferase [Isosphaeraceae bacterium]